MLIVLVLVVPWQATDPTGAVAMRQGFYWAQLHPA